MWASTIFRLARTMRCATVVSVSRNALAISAVVKPATARRVNATWASCESAGWQHVKISRRRSSDSTGSSAIGDRSRSATFSRYLLSRRRMSMARRLAVVINHAPGLSGIPCSGHFSNATTRLSWTTSSARSKSPSTRTSAAVSRPASSRKTAATAASVAPCVLSGVLALDHGPHFDDPALAATRPGLGHRQCLVQVLDVDDREPAHDFLGLDVRSVRDDRFAVLETDGRRAARSPELLASDDLAGPAVLVEPLVDLLVGRVHLVLRHLLPHLLVFDTVREHQDVLHLRSPFRAVSSAASFTRRTAGEEIDGSGSGELRLLLGQEGHDADRGIVAQSHARKVARLDVQRLIERQIVAPLHGVLDHRDRKSRCLGQLRRQPVYRGLVIDGCGGDVDPAHRRGLVRGQPCRLDHEAQSLRLTNQARQALGASGARDDPERRLGLADPRPPVFDHDAVVTAQGELASAAKSVTVDGRDHRFGTSLDRGEMLVHALHECADLTGSVRRAPIDAAQHAQVRAYAEVLLVVGSKHDDAHGPVVAKLVEGRRDLLPQLFGDRVEAVAMHDDSGDGPLAPDVDELAHQAVNRGMPPATSITAPVM